MPPTLWRFADSVSDARQRSMALALDFRHVVRMVQSGEIKHFAWESPDDAALRGCQRAVFLLCVGHAAYDGFFNSTVGYRAQFAQSASAGIAANTELLDLLEPSLLRFALRTEPGTDRVIHSLRGPDSKVWVHEREVQLQLGERDAQILYEPWQRATEDGVGLLAPIGEFLEVKGSWVDDAGRLRLNPKKAHRADEIHRVGFS